MISYLKGQPKVSGKELTIIINNVGYEVKATAKTCSQLSTLIEAELYIYTHVREDQISLYGFLSLQQKELFKLLLSVSGVGPATAQQIVDKKSDQIISAVQEANLGFFQTVPRVGKKLAQKIIIDLRGKLGELNEINLKPLSPKQLTVTQALQALGWDENHADQIFEKIDVENLTEEQAIKQILKEIGKHD